MLASKLDIMNTGWLNLVFAGRNQAYGAYELRRDNSRNTNKALLIATGAFVFILASPTIYNKIIGFIPKAAEKVDVTVVKLLPAPPIEQSHPIPPPPKQATAVPQHSTITFPPPIVKPDIMARQDPPTEAQLVDKDPGQRDIKGDLNAAPIIDETPDTKNSAGAVTEDERTVFTAVEISPAFPGGEAAFGKFLQTHIKYPPMARDNNIQGKAYIAFVVEKDGSLTDVKIVRDPGSGIGEEAMRVLKASPHWTPGIQNGKPVRVSYTVPVNFTLGND